MDSLEANGREMSDEAITKFAGLIVTSFGFPPTEQTPNGVPQAAKIFNPFGGLAWLEQQLAAGGATAPPPHSPVPPPIIGLPPTTQDLARNLLHAFKANNLSTARLEQQLGAGGAAVPAAGYQAPQPVIEPSISVDEVNAGGIPADNAHDHGSIMPAASAMGETGRAKKAQQVTEEGAAVLPSSSPVAALQTENMPTNNSFDLTHALDSMRSPTLQNVPESLQQSTQNGDLSIVEGHRSEENVSISFSFPPSSPSSSSSPSPSADLRPHQESQDVTGSPREGLRQEEKKIVCVRPPPSLFATFWAGSSLAARAHRQQSLAMSTPPPDGRRQEEKKNVCCSPPPAINPKKRKVGHVDPTDQSSTSSDKKKIWKDRE